MAKICFHSDPHGDFEPLLEAAAREAPDAVVLLGDYDLEVPFHQVLRPILERNIPVRWIHGNHDTDRDAWHDNLFGSELAEGAINGRVETLLGVRVAGLGGVFRGQIWNPASGPVHFPTRESFLANCGRGNHWRGGLPRRHRSSIWREDYDALMGQSADILVLHEAPECHPYGFRALGDLARAMGVGLVIHGHQHERYETRIDGGIRVQGLEQAGSLCLEV